MHRLARLSLANRALVALITIVIAAVGVFSMTQLKQELIPSIEVPQSQIITPLLGAAPEVVDEQISVPISTALRGVDGVDSVIATSSSGVSSISVSFDFGTDQKQSKRDIEDALSSLGLPEGAEPQVLSLSTASLPIMFLTASSNDGDLPALTKQVNDVVVPSLESVDGVGSASLSGATTQRITIAPDTAALAAQGITSPAISEALQANGLTLPLGSISDDGTLRPVQGGEALTTLDSLEALPLASTTQPGTTVTLGDIAAVSLEQEPATSITRANGSPALAILVTGSQGADVVGVSRTITDSLNSLGDQLPGVDLTVVFDQAPFIEESIEHLAVEGLLGLVFAIIVILIFLLSIRSTLVTAISIPLSVLVTFIGLNVGGYSLNMLTLGALTIAIGRVVDDSIVVIENIKRHLSYGEEKLTAILTAVREVAGAITSSTLTTVAVFLPIAVVGGLVGELFAPFALTVTIAMISSLLVALTIVPVLSFWFLKQPTAGGTLEETRAAAEDKERRSWLQRAYVPVLRSTQRHPLITITASVLLLVLTGGLVPLLKVDFLGNTGQNTLSLTQTFQDGTDLNNVVEGAKKVEAALDGVDGVKDVMVTAGNSGGILALSGGSGVAANFIITTDENADQDAVQDDIRDAVETVTGAGDIVVGSSSAGGLGGQTVDVTVTANDASTVAQAADEVYSALQGTVNTSGVSTDAAPAQPIVQVTVDRTAAVQQGLSEATVLGFVGTVLSPQPVGSITLNNEDLKIYISAGTTVDDLDELRALVVPTVSGLIPLTDIASVQEENVAAKVTRQDGEQVTTISVTPNEGELGAVTSAVQTEIDVMTLPDGASVKIGGLAQTQTDSFEQLGLAMLVAIAIVFLILVATLRSIIQPLVLLVSIPFAATGAIGLLLATGRPLGISALIGMLMLIGIVVTNAIVLIDLINQYRRQGESVHHAVFDGARQRLRPIVMTALATIFALTPMALGVTGSSGFISQDLAIVVIGGLVSSTLLTLILVPALYLLVENRKSRRDHPKHEAVMERTAQV